MLSQHFENDGCGMKEHNDWQHQWYVKREHLKSKLSKEELNSIESLLDQAWLDGRGRQMDDDLGKIRRLQA